MEAGVENLFEVICRLYEVSAVKFGDFTLKSGIKSPIYFDLRVIVSYPSLLETVSNLLWKCKPHSSICACICGVPYTALPLATVIAVKQNIPLVIHRKEAKTYGTKKMCEGILDKGQKCLIVEDVVTSGSSVLETAEALRAEGLVITDAVVLLDREQGGKENLAKHGITLHSGCKITQLMDFLHSAGHVSSSTVESVKNFVQENQAAAAVSGDNLNDMKGEKRLKMSFGARALEAQNLVAKQLFTLMEEKQTNLCVAVDVTSFSELLDLVDDLGPHICLLKTHIDILEDFTEEYLTELTEAAEKHKFLLFEDRKFGDIGNTTAEQYSGGIYHISSWSHLVTVHPLPGDSVIKGLKSTSPLTQRGCLLVAQMSSVENLFSREYTQASIKMADKHMDFVTGFISQSSVSDNPAFLHLTPGVKLGTEGDSLGQQYVSPEVAVKERGADMIIVGRGVTEAEDPAQAVVQYKEEAWRSYLERIGSDKS